MVSKKIGLIYTNEYERYNFGESHPLRPLRIKLTYSLMEKLGLLSNERLEIFHPRMCTREELEMVHSTDYIDAIKTLSEDPNEKNINSYKFGLGPGDTPIFKGMYEASALICGASLVAADHVWKENDLNYVFNPAGGLHHALKNKASGFCIFNDIGVAIKYLQRLQKNIRIAYLDIDCHHGDGVQWLFYDDPNVLTISFHESGKFLFPGTGSVQERGEGLGKGYTINFPLLPGTNNKTFLKLFRSTVPKLLEAYNPDILVSQLGVDMHFDDPLTQMGLSIKVYKDLAQTIKMSAREFCQDKWLAVGGGGYLMTVVPRVWTLFLANMLDIELENKLPDSWINQAKKEVPYEDTPYLLWDRGDKGDLQLLANPESARKIIEYTKSLITVNEEEYLPVLNKV